MATTSTTLSAAIGASDLTFIAAAATGATVGGIARIDDEYMFISGIASTTITVRSRGDLGTAAVAHNLTAPVVFGLASDVVKPAAGRNNSAKSSGRYAVVALAAAGAVPVPTENTLVVLNGGSAVAATLANPSALNDGVHVIFVAGTAHQHTVTLTTGYLGSSASDVFTWKASAGGTALSLVSYKGVWAHVSTSLIADESVAVEVA